MNKSFLLFFIFSICGASLVFGETIIVKDYVEIDNNSLEVTDGNPRELQVKDSGVTLDKLAPQQEGELYSFIANGQSSTVPAGTSGQVLTANGSGTPTFQDVPATPDDSITLDKLAPQQEGELYSFIANGQSSTVPAGTSGQVLTANGSGTPTFQDVPATPDDSITLDKLAPQQEGELYSFVGGGHPSMVPAGTTGQVLTANSSGAPTFQDLPASVGGKILQVVSLHDTTSGTISTSSSTYVDVTGVSLNITPSSTSSKILVMVNFLASNSSGLGHFRVLRDTTKVYEQEEFLNSTVRSSPSPIFVDSPNTTSQITYKLQVRAGGGTVTILGVSGGARRDRSIVLVEIAG
jgi:hypothetical protein